MAIVRLCGDIHFGKRFPHTTLKTAGMFEQLQDRTLAFITGDKLVDEVIQLGDMFDTFSTSDYWLTKGYHLMEKVWYTLAGNHDLSKNVEKLSAMGMLEKDYGLNVVSQLPVVLNHGYTDFTLVPHQHTQEQFEETLKGLDSHKTGRRAVLLLHCNFGASTGPAGDNYLPPALATELLKNKGFQLIVSGHEHNYREPMPGVIMLGAILPFSFGEMTDKYVLDFDTDTGEYELNTVWDSFNYAKVPYQDYLETACTDSIFFEITGDIDVADAIKLNKSMANHFKSSDKIIAIKNNTVLYKHTKGTDPAAYTKKNWVQQLLDECVTEEQKQALTELTT